VGGREGGRERRTGETDVGEPAVIDTCMAVHTDGDTLCGLVRWCRVRTGGKEEGREGGV